MPLSTAQVESRTQFSPLPQDVEQGHNQIQVNDRHIVLEPYEERVDWDALVIMLRLVMIGMLLVGFSLRQRELYEPTFDPVAPKFFLDSFHIPHLKVSEGEVSSTWDVALTISNVMNYSNVNILKLEAKVSYGENETLAVITLSMPKYTLESDVLLLDEEETKRVHLKLSTTGWEENQPIVDDNVVQAIAKDVQRGVTRFSLHMMVTGEVGLGDGLVAIFAMYPKCSNLEVKFVAGDQLGEAAYMIDRKPRECVGLIEWGPVKESI